ncbi:hypothetical protein BpHYR1_003779 [Brachionus plicatilis]|uniref:Uncharacterized protein n=1 Tax=Brachionus plicatilis TaxID=10195 RepID=A0A3M7RSZ9_BRAPC|nr:hypothetical protein BpHYR1_003779 [Brachionus plicatilis]
MNPDYDYFPREPIVVSSFYCSPNGKSTVRAYEIVNSNPYVVKIRKNKLDEPRFEVALSNFFGKIINFFVSTNRVSDYPSRKLNNKRESLTKTNINKEMAFHTKKNGGVIAIASLDLSNKKGDNSKLKEFVQRKVIVDRMNNKILNPNSITNSNMVIKSNIY